MYPTMHGRTECTRKFVFWSNAWL